MSSMQNLVDRLVGERNDDEYRYLDEQKQQWLQDLETLMQKLTTWLEPGVKREVFKVTRESESLAEPDLGVYDAPALRIQTLTRTPYTIRIRPRGLLIVGVIAPAGERITGASGRVDISNGPSRVMLLRHVAPGDQSGDWNVARDDGSIPLSEQSFTEALEYLLA